VSDVDQLPATPPATPSIEPRLRWWREIVYTVVLYGAYSSVRNQFGSNAGDPERAAEIAYQHALDVIAVERALRSYFEPALQQWYLDLPANGWIGFWNVFYGTAHFVVTAGALVWLYRKGQERYRLWRNTLAFTTLFALVGFATFSLMPPRLLDAPFEEFGPPPSVNDDAAEHGTFVDTLATFPTFWSFDSEALKDVSNQYAAMPSLHVAWAVWASLVMAPMVRRRWVRALVWGHPVATVFCIVVTANHFWLDAAGGLVILFAGYQAGRALTAFWQRRAARRPGSHRPDGVAVVAGAGEEPVGAPRPGAEA
jgi:hypothetical protein